MTIPFTSMPGAPDKPIRWWNFRRRAARLRFLELLAQTELRITLDGGERLAGNMENAYRTVVGYGSADHARGLAFADLLKMRTGCACHGNGCNESEHEAVISMRVPLDVRL